MTELSDVPMSFRSNYLVSVVRALATVAAMFFTLAQAAHADGFTVTFVEASPQSTSTMAAILKKAAHDCATTRTCSASVALQEIGRTRFALYEADAHAAHRQPPTLSPQALLAPADTRQLRVLWASPALQIPAYAFWVVTHVDAMPDYAAEVASMLKQLGQANAHEAGHVRTIVGAQLDHPNHFTLIEIWASRADFEAHEAAKPTRDFRMRLAPMIGALYDSRLYEGVE